MQQQTRFTHIKTITATAARITLAPTSQGVWYLLQDDTHGPNAASMSSHSHNAVAHIDFAASKSSVWYSEIAALRCTYTEKMIPAASIDVVLSRLQQLSVYVAGFEVIQKYMK